MSGHDADIPPEGSLAHRQLRQAQEVALRVRLQAIEAGANMPDGWEWQVQHFAAHYIKSGRALCGQRYIGSLRIAEQPAGACKTCVRLKARARPL